MIHKCCHGYWNIGGFKRQSLKTFKNEERKNQNIKKQTNKNVINCMHIIGIQHLLSIFYKLKMASDYSSYTQVYMRKPPQT